MACVCASFGISVDSAAALDSGRVSPGIKRVAGAGTRLTHSGLYRVRPQHGPALLTHGPDAQPPPAPLEERAGPRAGLPDGVGFEAGDIERTPVCATSDAQRVIYAHPVAGPDRIATVRPQIQAAIRRMDSVLNAESIASGGPGADYRVRCTPEGDISVEDLATTGSSFSQVVNSLRTAGLDSELVDFTIFYDGSGGGSCGIASYAADESLSVDNASNFGGGYAVIYNGCWYGETPMHEIGHTMGAVQYGAPHSTGTGGHCWEEQDVMCYSPDGGSLHQEGTVMNCPGETPRFDCNFDDYFDSAPEPGEYLATHWNLGSPLNAFIAFGGAAPPAPPEAQERWHIHRIRVPHDTRELEIWVRGSEGVTLYVSRGHRPTESRYACRSRAGAGGALCRIKHPERGRWMVGVLKPTGTTSATLRIEKQRKARNHKR